jgi:hypothetical protein
MFKAAVTLSSAAALAACVPGGPIYFGAPIVNLQGAVYSIEDRAPLAGAEVCVFGADTVCIAADQDGRYAGYVRDRQLLEGGHVRVRFRIAGLRPAFADLDSLVPGDQVTLDCAISTRMTLGTDPVPCLPAPAT